MTSRPTVALYHHLPPGGAERAMYELVRRTSDDFRYVLYEVVPSDRDPFAGATRPPIHDVVAEVHSVAAPVGGASRRRRWTRAIPAIIRAERRIADDINRSEAVATVVHHQRHLQAPTLLRLLAAPSIYVCQEPRRRSFEYALRHPVERSLLRSVADASVAPLEWWAARLDIRSTRSADAILCNSDHSREYIWRAYGRDATVIRLGADPDRFILPDEDRRIDEVLAVGSLDPTKGHDLAVEALATLPEAIRPRLRIIHNRAAHRAEGDLRRLAAERGVELTLEPGVDDSTLVRRYQQARAVIATGRVEPLGLTVLEAAACGTPAVAVREGGYRETVIDGVTGYLTDRDPAALGEAVGRLLRDELPATRDRLRADTNRRFDWDAAAARYTRVIGQAIAGCAPISERRRTDQRAKKTSIAS